MLETIIGLRGPDFVMMAADTTQARSIIIMKSDQNKFHKIADKLFVAAVGEPGDTIQFTEYVSKNIALYRMRNGYDLSPKAAAHFTRHNLAEFLRSRTPYQVNMLLGGYDEKEGPELQLIDYLANAKSLPHGGYGYGSMFCTSVFDRYYKDNITQAEAYEVLKKCHAEIQKRLFVKMPNFNVWIVDKDGIRSLPDLTEYN